MSRYQEYDLFVEKFKPKKTTDDCYTPPEIYEVVERYVRDAYDLHDAHFVRPFYPGGDYEHYDYKAGDVVVDNPPFSIFAKIVTFYQSRGIKFFLFCPNLTAIGQTRYSGGTILAVAASVTYDNGAVVATSFVTNLEDADIVIKSEPDLYKAIQEANNKRLRQTRKQLPKYKYPVNVCTAAQVQQCSKYGVWYACKRSESVFISALDSQKSQGKAIFGGGLLLSEQAAAEKAAAEKAAAEKAAAKKAAAEKAAAIVWKLSERENEIISQLDRGAGNAIA